MTPELASSPLLATTPTEDVSALDRFNVPLFSIRWVFSGTGTRTHGMPAMIQYLDHRTTTALPTDLYYTKKWDMSLFQKVHVMQNHSSLDVAGITNQQLLFVTSRVVDFEGRYRRGNCVDPFSVI
ncbi:hypothetical protein TNCV_4290471 [Trichonephila clavipes]|nr:hypothetical protein TNCV_4290471 [Trichonephila clavipes]